MKNVAKSVGVSAAFCAVIALGACTSTSSPFANRASRTLPQPEQLNPVESSSVSQSSLPPVGSPGQSQDPQVVSDAANNGNSLPNDGGTENLFGETDPSFVTLDDLDKNTNVAGRDLTGPLTVLKLLGVWTVQSGDDTCRLNLTQSAKGSTGRYRASAPGCEVPAIASVSSWQLAGKQVQLFNEAGQLIGALLQNGDRFVGTMVGGQGISMVS